MRLCVRRAVGPSAGRFAPAGEWVAHANTRTPEHVPVGHVGVFRIKGALHATTSLLHAPLRLDADWHKQEAQVAALPAAERNGPDGAESVNKRVRGRSQTHLFLESIDPAQGQFVVPLNAVLDSKLTRATATPEAFAVPCLCAADDPRLFWNRWTTGEPIVPPLVRLDWRPMLERLELGPWEVRALALMVARHELSTGERFPVYQTWEQTLFYDGHALQHPYITPAVRYAADCLLQHPQAWHSWPEPHAWPPIGRHSPRIPKESR